MQYIAWEETLLFFQQISFGEISRRFRKLEHLKALLKFFKYFILVNGNCQIFIKNTSHIFLCGKWNSIIQST